jgi:phosphoglucosamine mutase
VLQAVQRSGKTIAQILDGMAIFPQVLINIRLKPGQVWATSALEAMVKTVEAELGNTGRVLIRPSGTEPLVRVMVEARDAAQAKSCGQRMADVIKAG